MPALLIVFIQVMCGIHAVRSGQERYWLYLIIGLPGLGCAIYALAVMVPDWLGSRDGKRLIRHAHDKIDPERHLRALREELEIAETSQNHLHLADELARIGQHEEAAVHYGKALSGIFITDPHIMLKLAAAQLASRDALACRNTLDDLIKHNPDFMSPDGHLLYARALTAQGELDKAEDEYRVLIDYYSGPEARFRYAQLLKDKGDFAGAKHQLETIALIARRSKPHYRKLHKAWLAKVNQELKAL
ncbi:hypothetical protein SOASR030_04250 [Leminorella grimontii]|uniref:Tetratricopeptide repeat protein n=1 Tax=Leminorella grimontii TaxID=82981 RepID=A0AAV5MWU3_9GAMM|nr:hypothetical protein [Leminorella grimontii]KFC96489.1 putative membrane protein [Leminorella grimontii ATCC 33999 = DSM 5078]GKX54313.1 hypothetical protein SOASR030_04250 [Leminorella grimontii]GKX57754.1 hypothetical protein SOASR031_00690 [Leminorella grimontii]VFS59549.1 Uncharacterized protein conserved in bacteria containing a divergent form of TPR repeats [Leminorella grimontii]